MRPEAVIFDMDGVIVDSEPLFDQHVAAYYEEVGVDTTKSMPSFHGRGAKARWTALKETHNLSESVEDLIAGSREGYLKFLKKLPKLPIVPGVRELIEQLEVSGAKLAVASSASPERIEIFLSRLDLDKHFLVAVSGDEVTHSKPEPDLFLLAAEKLDIEPSDCSVIEDATSGVEAAKAGGMKCLGFAGLPHNHEDLSRADVIVTDFINLAEYVKQGGKLLQYS